MSRLAQAVQQQVNELVKTGRAARRRHVAEDDSPDAAAIAPTDATEELAGSVESGVSAPDETAPATTEGDNMAKKKVTTTNKRAKAGKAKKKVTRHSAKRKSSGRSRVTAGAVFTFVKSVNNLQPRAKAILNAIEKIGSGTAVQVAARVVKSDYDGKQELVYLSGFFLRKFVKLGAVSVEA